jgi:hypothetical protein
MEQKRGGLILRKKDFSKNTNGKSSLYFGKTPRDF